MSLKFSEGQRVRLKPNHEEGWPEEFGEVCGGEELDWGNSYIVQVDEYYRNVDGDGDDGLREVTEDQMEPIN